MLKHLIFILSVFLSCELIAQDHELNYATHITIAEGLSNNSITCLLEDSRGFLWVGTFNGLNRYNGYQIKVIKNTFDKEILPSNRVRAIIEDKKGIIWIGTEDGVSVYNYLNEKFTTIYSNKQKDILAGGPGVLKIIENKIKEHVYCITAWGSIYVFDYSYNLVCKYDVTKDFEFGENIFTDGILLDESNILFSTTESLVHFNTENDKFSRIKNKQINNCTSVTGIGKGKVLVTQEMGVAIISFEIKENTFFYEYNRSEFNNIHFLTATIDNSNNLWLGTFNKGLIYIDNVKAFVKNESYQKSYFKLENDEFWVGDILATKTKGCWVGTFHRGIYKFRIPDSPFKFTDIRLNENLRMHPNRTFGLAVLDSNKVYVTTNNRRVDLVNTKADKRESHPIKFTNYSNEKVQDIFVDTQNRTWIKYNKKLGWVSENSPVFHVIQHKNLDELKDFRSMAEDKNGNIWIRCRDHIFKLSLDEIGGLIDCESLNKHPFFKRPRLSYVRDIYFDSAYDYLWIGTIHNGLYRLSLQEDKPIKELEIKQFVSDVNDSKSISCNYVTTINRTSNNELWIGTQGGGICKVMDRDKEPYFIPYTQRHGLSNNDVHIILSDENNNLWIGTSFGLNKFNPRDLSFRKYYKEDGLPFEEFRPLGAVLENGILFFAGFTGYVYFDKNELTPNQVKPSVVFEELRVLNQPISPGDTMHERVLLKQCLNNTKEIVLNYNENFFSFDITSLHYSKQDKYYLKYQLLPNNKEWIKVPSSKQNIQYNGLQPGDYVFKVMASNSINEWTEPRILKITIKPPWWLTKELYIIYIILLTLLVYGVARYWMKLIKLRHRLQIKQIEKDKVTDINEAKLRYFSDISHEIKTPVTLISGPLDLLIDNSTTPSNVKVKLQLMKRQANKISQLVEQVHDFQKSDANKLKLINSHFYFDILIQDLIKDYDFIAKHQNKTLEITTTETKTYVFADKDKVEKIFNNLINNSFKFTSPGNSIKINYTSEGENLIVSVTDTGKGIKKEDLAYIFERFYQTKQKNYSNLGGSGIGLAFSKRLVEMHLGTIKAESEINEGTTITVSLPVVKDASAYSVIEAEEKQRLTEQELCKKTYLTADTEEIIKASERKMLEAHIFFVEDNDDMRRFVSSILKEHYEVTAFSNGLDCLNAFEEEWPDIVVSDVLMPRLNGFDLCKNLKADIKTSHIPVILLTACATQNDQIKGSNDGADAYITKPFNMTLLISRIESILQGRKQLRERFQINIPLTRNRLKNNGLDDVFLEKLYALMENNLNNTNVDIKSFAKELYINRSYFFGKVKALTNHTPYELLKSYRIKRAAELLVQDKLPVNEVFLMTGFKSRAHFFKTFREYYNLTPAKYVASQTDKYSGK